MQLTANIGDSSKHKTMSVKGKQINQPSIEKLQQTLV